ncbi:MAG: fructosamine kinase family protein [Chloroflexota bacterium]|nr:MAG: fructosamine kinase family protein [Chloroflexota bacterium]
MGKEYRGLRARIEAELGFDVRGIRPLSGGSVAQVHLVELSDGSRVVAKQDREPGGQLAVEGQMLHYLAERSSLPVPAVLLSDDDILLLEFLPGANRFTARSQRHAAELLAELHGITAGAYGFDGPTLIGGLHQPNPWTQSWLAFFREQRLLYMGRQALDAGRLPAQVFGRLETFAGRLERWLSEPDGPALIHGDAWGGNVLATDDRITGFLDPAIYYADPEIELAFTTLFGTFDDSFFSHYQEIRPIRPGFMSERREIYNLYPLLVHVRLFGGGYVESVSGTLADFGH